MKLLLLKLENTKKYDLMLDIFTEESNWNVRIWNYCLKSLVRVNMTRNAILIFERMKRMGIVDKESYETALDAYISLGDKKMIWKIYREASLEDVILNSRTYERVGNFFLDVQATYYLINLFSFLIH